MAQFPTLAPRALTPGLQVTNFASRAHSGKGQVRRIGTALLTFDVAWSGLSRAQGQPLWAFIQSQNGRFGRFEFKPALLCDSSNTSAPATATVASAAAARQKIVLLSGLPVSRTVLNAGDYIRFSNHTKVYVLETDAVSNASGAASVTLAFELIEPLTVGMTAKLRDITVQCSLIDDTQSLSVRPPFLHDISTKMIEAL